MGQMPNRLFTVDQVELIADERDPGTFVMRAEGRALGTGWTGVRLVPVGDGAPGPDGCILFELVGNAPVDATVAAGVGMRHAAERVIEVTGGAGFAGVTCLAAENSKQALVTGRLGLPGARRMRSEASEPGTGFARDILPLFREVDRRAMRAVRNLDLTSRAQVAALGALILERLEAGTMPPDGPWPARDVALFRRWLADGAPD